MMLPEIERKEIFMKTMHAVKSNEIHNAFGCFLGSGNHAPYQNYLIHPDFEHVWLPE